MDDKNYVDFLNLTGTHKAFVEDINNFLLNNNCKRNIKIAKSGFTVSYLLQDIKKPWLLLFTEKQALNYGFIHRI